MYIDDLGSAFGEEVAEFIRKQEEFQKKVFKKHKWKTKEGKLINLLNRDQCDDFHFENICKCLSEKFKFRDELIEKLKLERRTLCL